MNKPTRFLPPLIALSIGLLVASNVLAENNFRVSTETGLELGDQKPKPVAEKKPKPVSPTVAEKAATEITCSGETTFDGKAGIVVFVEGVKVKDPQFELTADKLTAYLKKSAKEPAAPSPTPADAKSDDAKSPASGLERAVAEGNVIISQDKVDEKTGEVTRYVGKGAKADYNALTGDMTLSGWPQIQQGFNNQVATEEGTVMIMNKDGHLRTKGPSMTVIKTDSKPAKTP